MQMSKKDICKEYKEAKHKRQQIQILADLNQVSVDYIKEILKEEGIWQTPGPKPGTKKAAIINKDFEDAVNEMIAESNEQRKQDVILAAAQYGLEFMEAKIAETEKFIEEIQKELDELKATRDRTQKALGVTET